MVIDAEPLRFLPCEGSEVVALEFGAARRAGGVVARIVGRYGDGRTLLFGTVGRYVRLLGAREGGQCGKKKYCVSHVHAVFDILLFGPVGISPRVVDVDVSGVAADAALSETLFDLNVYNLHVGRLIRHPAGAATPPLAGILLVSNALHDIYIYMWIGCKGRLIVIFGDGFFVKKSGFLTVSVYFVNKK